MPNASSAPSATARACPASPSRPATTPRATSSRTTRAYATGHGFDPARELVRAELALDPRTLAQAGVHLEEPLYLAEPADADAALTWYRARIGPAAPSPSSSAPAPPTPAPPNPSPKKPT